MNPIPDQVAGFELNFAEQKARTTDGCSDRKFSWPHESWDQREVQLSGPSWVDPQDRHIAGSGLEACHGLSRGRICDRQPLNTEACPKCANEVDWPTLQLTGYCTLLYCGRNIDTRTLPTRTRSATRGSVVCCALAMLANVAVNEARFARQWQ